MARSSALQPGGAERRQASIKRHLLRLTGSLVSLESESSGNSGEAIVRNISLTGVLLETDRPVTMGQTVHIDLGAAGRQAAEVRWADGKLLGCQFLEPLAKARVSAALLQGSHPAQRQPTAQEQVPSPLTPGSHLRDFGLAIAWARKTRGVNQAEMARAIGVSTTTICKWERGHAQPRKEALIRLQRYLEDAQDIAAELPLEPAQARKAPGQDIHRIMSEFKARLAEQIGVKAGAIEIQLTIRDVTSL